MCLNIYIDIYTVYLNGQSLFDLLLQFTKSFIKFGLKISFDLIHFKNKHLKQKLALYVVASVETSPYKKS